MSGRVEVHMEDRTAFNSCTSQLEELATSTDHLGRARTEPSTDFGEDMV